MPPAPSRRDRSPAGSTRKVEVVFEQTRVARFMPLVQLLLVGLVFFFGGVFWAKRPQLGPAPERPASPPAVAAVAERPVATPAPQQPANAKLAEVKLEPRMPAEFEHQDALLLGCNELVRYHPKTLMEIVMAVHGRIRLMGLISNQEERSAVEQLLAANGLPRDAIRLFELPVQGMWVRDYGPIFVTYPDGYCRILDTDYTQRSRPTDNDVPKVLAGMLGVPHVDVPLSMEGGNLLSNGEGLCLTSTAMMVWNEHRGYDLQKIGFLLGEHWGFKNWVYLVPLLGEPSSHIDMFCTFVAPDVAVIGQYDPNVDPINAKVLDQGAEILASTVTSTGKPLRVYRIPMPSNKDGVWRTYTNVIFANGVLLVPNYPQTDPDLDSQALALYTSLLPEWKVVGIDATKLIPQRGALHCVSINAPLLRGLRAVQ